VWVQASPLVTRRETLGEKRMGEERRGRWDLLAREEHTRE
jgi:hypothetical protein